MSEHEPTPGQLTLDGDEVTRARARTGDPWTSHAAARSLSSEELRDSQRDVLACLKLIGRPTHDEEWMEVYKREAHTRGWKWQGDSGLRSRRSELEKDFGLVCDSGLAVKLRSGRWSKRWEVVDASSAADGSGWRDDRPAGNPE